MSLSFWPPHADRKCTSGVPSGSNTELTNAKLTEGGSSDGVACDWLSGMVPMALTLGLEEEGGLKGLRVLWVLEVKFWVSEKEDRPYELS